MIGQRDTELEWVKKSYTLNHRERTYRIERDHPTISISRQVELLDISRASLYTAPKEDFRDKHIMDYIDGIYTKRPFYGS